MVAILYERDVTWPTDGPMEIQAPSIDGQVQISPTVAWRRANRYLTLEVAMEFQPGDPILLWGERPIWRLPIQLHLPELGPLATVGTVEIDASTGQVLPLSIEQIDQMRNRAHDLVTRLTSPATSIS